MVYLKVLDQRDRPVTSSGREADAMRRNSRWGMSGGSSFSSLP